MAKIKVLAEYRKAKDRGQKHEEEWKALKEAYAKAHPELAAELTRRLNGELPKDWETLLPAFAESDKADATRNLSGIVLNALAPKLPELVGGSADLTPSNKTQLKCTHDFQKGSYDGRYFRFGVREHGMAAICNGIASYGGLVPFCATFLNFIGYAMGAVRLSALSRRQVIYVATHDSIGLGEDGPTHQPVEMLLACRATPNLYVFRPGDGNETSGSYACALKLSKSPSLLALSRQNVPQLQGSSAEKVSKGAYVLRTVGEAKESEKPTLTFVATGTEVSLAVEAAEQLVKAVGGSVRIVSMPCERLFDETSADYKRSVFPEGVPIIAIEAAAARGWERYAHYTVGMHTFGESGKGEDVMEHFGFTTSHVVEKAQAVLKHFSNKPVPDLLQLIF